MLILLLPVLASQTDQLAHRRLLESARNSLLSLSQLLMSVRSLSTQEQTPDPRLIITSFQAFPNFIPSLSFHDLISSLNHEYIPIFS